jgi:hypothetical protein
MAFSVVLMRKYLIFPAFGIVKNRVYAIYTANGCGIAVVRVLPEERRKGVN